MHPEINTLEEWNARLGLCGCCQMPVCPLPVIEGEHDTATLCHFFDSLASIDADLGLIRLRSKNVAATLETDTGWTDFSNPEVFEVRQNTSESLDYTLSRATEVAGATTGACPALGISGSYTHSIRERGRDAVTEDVEYDYTLESSASSAHPDSTPSQWRGQTILLPNPVGFPGDPDDYPEAFVVDITENFFPIATDTLNDLGASITVTRAPSDRPERSHDLLNPAGDWDTVIATYTPWLESTATAALDGYTPTYGSASANLSDIHSAFAIATDEDDRINGPTSKRFARYRWTVPAEHEGTWYRIDWDVVFTPADHDPDDPFSPQPSVLSSDFFEWDGEDRTSDWIELAPPTDPGEVRLSNVRFQCYRSDYGAKPQVLAE